MGDEVKITVIATGFKQQEMPQRRERMLAEATLPTVRYDVPIQARIPLSRSVSPRFASEVEAPALNQAAFDTSAAAEESALPAGTEAAAALPELVPVPASVFDDAFFRNSPSLDEVDGSREGAYSERIGEANRVSVSTGAQADALHAAESEASGAVVRGPSLGGVPMEEAESDELDIPAFLRRGN
jgi:cell division protein FtsZ